MLRVYYLDAATLVAASLASRLNARDRTNPNSLTPEIILLNKKRAYGGEALEEWEARDLEISTLHHQISSFERDLSPLDYQQTHVLHLATSGLNRKQLSEATGLTPRQVDRVKRQILEQLDCESLVTATVLAVKKGWLPRLLDIPDDVRLTEAQKSVFKLLIKGYDDEAIAQELSAELRTVEGHITKGYSNLGVHKNRSHATRVILEARVFEPQSKRAVQKNDPLTHEEIQILNLMAMGDRIRDIEKKLAIGGRKVVDLQRTAMVKLGMEDEDVKKIQTEKKVELVLVAHNEGLIDIGQIEVKARKEDVLCLTEQEQTALEMMIEGYTNEDIKEDLMMSDSKFYNSFLPKVFSIFQTRRRPYLAGQALAAGFVESIPANKTNGRNRVKFIKPDDI